MSNQIQTKAATHSEIADGIFQVFTIVVVGLFSALTLLHVAAQIV